MALIVRPAFDFSIAKRSIAKQSFSLPINCHALSSANADATTILLPGFQHSHYEGNNAKANAKENKLDFQTVTAL